MTSTSIARSDAGTLEQVLVQGDLSKLTEPQRVSYYNTLCQSLGLNPLTQPFQYLTLQGKLILYARRDATEQLRKIHGVSIEKLEKERHEDVYVVTAYARDASGRTDASTGAVAIGNLKGEALANGLMKAETKAKRRVTLSICGLGLLDETEVETGPKVIDVQTGEEKPARPTPPHGFDAWWATLPGVAEEGTPTLQAAWKAAPPDYRKFIITHLGGDWGTLKDRAKATDEAAK